MSLNDLVECLRAGDLGRAADVARSRRDLATERDAQGMSAVVVALSHGAEDVARILAEPLLAGGEGGGPRLPAGDLAALGETERLRELLDAQPARATETGPEGFTPLHLAAFFGRRDACALLLDRGADVAAVASNDMRVQPLYSAAAGRHAPVVALLLSRGAPVNATQRHGYTPLHSACANGDPESVRLLLKAGADARLAADDGRTALDLARSSKRAELVVPMIEAELSPDNS